MRKGLRRSAGGLAAVLFGAVFWLAGTQAQTNEAREPATPAQGHVVAERFCKGCHLIDSSPDAITSAGVPSFRGIANRPGQSAQHIMSILIKPHAPMPDIHLTDGEIRNLLAYFESLRTDASIPPLELPPLHVPLPQLPVPS
jgi:mono/diheme cytochrome c family protein